MKISKLFHWLYAILMLLPVAMFIPTAFYYGFNEQAQAQERTIETLDYYNTSSNDEFYTSEDLNNETVYSCYYFEVGDDDTDICPIEYCMPTGLVEWSNTTTYNGCGFQTDSDGNLYLYNNGIKYDLLGSDFSYTFVFVIGNYRQEFIEFFDGNNFIKNEEFIGSDILVAKTDIVSETYTMSITDSMSTAWTNTWSNPLFSWSANGFLIAPFNYITELFGMPNNSTFSLALNYWLTISIVYLVFDLVMYVPLLAHRWIDKGMVE